MIFKVQANVLGFSGSPASLFSAYESETRTLVFAAESDYIPQKKDDCILISNDENPECDRDMLFSQNEIIQKGVPAFFQLKNALNLSGGARLNFSQRAIRCNPESMIEIDGFKIDGAAYRLAEGISNMQAAALLTCAYIVHEFEPQEFNSQLAENIAHSFEIISI